MQAPAHTRLPVVPTRASRPPAHPPRARQRRADRRLQGGGRAHPWTHTLELAHLTCQQRVFFGCACAKAERKEAPGGRSSGHTPPPLLTRSSSRAAPPRPPGRPARSSTSRPAELGEVLEPGQGKATGFELDQQEGDPGPEEGRPGPGSARSSTGRADEVLVTNPGKRSGPLPARDAGCCSSPRSDRRQAGRVSGLLHYRSDPLKQAARKQALNQGQRPRLPGVFRGITGSVPGHYRELWFYLAFPRFLSALARPPFARFSRIWPPSRMS